MADEQEYYAVLGVARDADDETIRLAYRRLARRYHPDIAGPSGLAQMQRLNVAYRVLSDPERRRAYDATLGIVTPFPTAPPPPAPSPAPPPEPAPARTPPPPPRSTRPRVGSVGVSQGPLREKVSIMAADAQPIATLALSGDGRRAALGLLDGQIVLCDAGSGRALGTLGMGDRARAGVLQEVRLSPGGNIVAAWGFLLGLRVWRVGEGTSLWNTGMNAPSGLMDVTLVDEPPFVRLAVPDAPPALADDDPFRWADEGKGGTAVYARPLRPPIDPGWAVPLRCEENNRAFFSGEGGALRVRQRILSADGRALLTVCTQAGAASPDLHLHLWELEHRSLRGTLAPRRSVQAEVPSIQRFPVVATPDLAWLALPTAGPVLVVYELRGRGRHRLEAGPFNEDARAALSPDAAYFALTRGTTLDLWETATGKRVQQWRFGDEITSLDFAPSGPRPILAIGLRNGLAEVWQ